MFLLWYNLYLYEIFVYVLRLWTYVQQSACVRARACVCVVTVWITGISQKINLTLTRICDVDSSTINVKCLLVQQHVAPPSFFHHAITWLDITIYVNECCTTLILFVVCTWVFTFCYFFELTVLLFYTLLVLNMFYYIRGRREREKSNGKL